MNLALRKLLLGGSRSVPLPEFFNNLVAHYNYDECALDSQNGAHDQEKNGVVTFADEPSGRSILFNGQSGITTPNSNSLQFTSGGGVDVAFTYVFDIYPNALPGLRFLKSKRIGASNGLEYDIYIDASGHPSVLLYTNGTNFIGARTNTAVAINTKYQLIIVYRGTKLFSGFDIYINGVLQPLTNIGSGTYTGMVGNTGQLCTGNRADNPTNLSNGFQGRIDNDFLFRGYAMTAEDVALMWNSGNRFNYVNRSRYYIESVHVLHSRDNFVLATDIPSGGTNLKWSNNGGASYRDFNWGSMWAAGVPVYDRYPEMGYIFDDGSFIIGCSNKVYRNADGLQSAPIEIITQLPDGSPYPIHTPAVASRPGSYYSTFTNDRNRNYVNGNEIFFFGNYCNTSQQGYGAAPVQLWYTRDRGVTIKSVYRFGQNPNHRDNGGPAGGGSGTFLGDASNTVITRHVHSFARRPNTNEWYSCVGDNTTGPPEVHWLRHIYDPVLDSWTNTLIINSVGENTKWKAVGFQFVGDTIYWASDATGSPVNAEKGIFSASITDVIANGAAASFTTLVAGPNYQNEFVDMMITDSGFMIASTVSATKADQLLIANAFGATRQRYGLMRLGGTSGFMMKMCPPDSRGYIKVSVGELWTQPVQTLWIKPTT